MRPCDSMKDLFPQAVVLKKPHHQGTGEQCRISGAPADLLNGNLHFKSLVQTLGSWSGG